MSQKITIIPGDGIGPSIMEATLKLLNALDCELEYAYTDVGLASLEKGDELIPQKALSLIEETQIALKGPITTPIGKGFSSINVALRKRFELYANVRPVVSLPGTKSRYEAIDIITIRENTEGLYSGEKQTINEEGTYAEATSVVTKTGAERIVRFAFEHAKKKGRKKVTVVHKANILKTTSGLFLKTAREVASHYPELPLEEMIVDNTCMQLVMNPHQFDLIVTTNLFGDIISDLCAGLVGGLGLAPGANIGTKAAIFEAVHGSAPDIAGKNIANPTSLMLAAGMMLDHLDLPAKATKLRLAIIDTIKEGKAVTADLGGNASTTEFTEAVLSRL